MNANKSTNEVVNPGFTTEEMETSKIRCGFEFELTSFIYNDNCRQYPTSALGIIKSASGKHILAKWNHNGQCLIKGERVQSFDLVMPTQEVNIAHLNL